VQFIVITTIIFGGAITFVVLKLLLITTYGDDETCAFFSPAISSELLHMQDATFS